MYFNRDFLLLTLLICLDIATTKFYQPENMLLHMYKVK